MRGADGKPTVADHMWISYFTGMGETNGEGCGNLTAGYGARQKPDADGGKIGPEFTFGLTMDKALSEPVLIIKTAWGGKSLHTDFRPLSAGPYVLSAAEMKAGKFATQEERDKKAAATGHYYRLMNDHVKFVLKDIKRVVPSHDEKDGYELAGFVWLQGWNDMVDRNVYPELLKDSGKTRFATYSEWLATFIRDARKDLGAPKLPFYELEQQVKAGKMTKEVAETTAKEFEANLITPTEEAPWKRGASNAEYHYLGCAKTFALMGRAFAEVCLAMKKSG